MCTMDLHDDNSVLFPKEDDNDEIVKSMMMMAADSSSDGRNKADSDNNRAILNGVEDEERAEDISEIPVCISTDDNESQSQTSKCHAHQHQGRVINVGKERASESSPKQSHSEMSAQPNPSMATKSHETDSKIKCNNTHEDVLNLEKLFSLLEASKNAGDLIARKNILLLIGGTGAGKTTTTLYFAGASFEEIEVDGRDHYKPISLPDPELSRFAVMGGGKSVTKTIDATSVTLTDTGESVTICDIPGFGDSEGTEMDISNGLGIIRALRRAASVKPVLVLNHENMTYQRYQGLKDTLRTVTRMLGKTADFASFGYIFTRCGRKQTSRVHKELTAFLRDHSLDNDAVLSNLVQDMIQKTNPVAIAIDPQEQDKASVILKELWSNQNRLKDPENCFVDFVSEKSTLELNLQMTRLILRIESYLKSSNVSCASTTLHQLSRLAEMIPLPVTKQSFRQGQMKMVEYSSRLLDRISNAYKDMDIATAENNLGELRCMVDFVPLRETRDAFEQGLGVFADMTNQLKSDSGSLVDSLVATENLNEYRQHLFSLKQKLFDLSRAQQICKYYNVDLQEGFASIIDLSCKKLFKANEVNQSPAVVQGCFQRHIDLVQILHEIVGTARIRKETNTFIGDVSSLAKNKLDVVESTLCQPITADAAMKKIENVVNFLGFLTDFIDTTEFPASLGLKKDQLYWIKTSFEAVLHNVTQKTLDGLTRLKDVSTSMETLLFTANTWSVSGLQFPILPKELLYDRTFLKFISSSDILLTAITNHMKSNSPYNSCEGVLSQFDSTIVNFLTQVATFAQNNAKALRDIHISDGAKDKMVDPLKDAEALMQFVNVTSDACLNFVDLNPTVLRDKVTSTACTKVILEGVIKESRKVGRKKVVGLLGYDGSIESPPPRKIAKLSHDQWKHKNHHPVVHHLDKREIQKDDVEWNEHFEKLKKYKERFGCFPNQMQPERDLKLGRWYYIQRSLLQLWIKTGEYLELKDWILTGEYKYHGIIHGQEQIAGDRCNKMTSIGAL